MEATWRTWAMATIVSAVVAESALAGAVLTINEDASLDLGLRVQALGISTKKERDSDGKFEDDTDFRLRRGRLRLKASVTDYATAFIQTEVGGVDGGAGLDMRVIDAWVCVKPHELCQIVAGENMVPASRQNLTSSGALMAGDRPGMNYKTLTWGTRSVYGFATATYIDSDAGLRGDVDVRDLGVTLFGHHSVVDKAHVKYYAGGYDGVQRADTDEIRIAGRVQVNVGDPESKYFNFSTYLGGKTTVGLGASIDHQPKVAGSIDVGLVDYTFYAVDLFGEAPVGPGFLTVEGAYESLDLGGARQLDHDGDVATAPRDATRAEGDGFYVQAGYLIDKFQPWALFEQWTSDAEGDKGSYEAYRVGLTYFIRGQNANLKIGYERMKAASDIATSTEDTIDSFLVGAYVTY